MPSSNTSLIAQLAEIELEHESLHNILDGPEGDYSFGELDARRMKKRKLWLKDRIRLLKSMLYPDVIA